MAVSSLPTSKNLEFPLLQLLADKRAWGIVDIVDALAAQYSLTEVDLAERLPSGQSRFYHRCNWARLDLKAAGLVEFPKRGYLRITERGLQELHECRSSRELTREEHQRVRDEPAAPKAENIAKTPRRLSKRIVIDPNILMGKPSIRGTRLGVEFIIDLLAHGWSEAELLENYPSLVPEDIRACLAYASAVVAKDIQTTSIHTPGTNPGYSPSLNAG